MPRKKVGVLKIGPRIGPKRPAKKKVGVLSKVKPTRRKAKPKNNPFHPMIDLRGASFARRNKK